MVQLATDEEAQSPVIELALSAVLLFSNEPISINLFIRADDDGSKRKEEVVPDNRVKINQKSFLDETKKQSFLLKR